MSVTVTPRDTATEAIVGKTPYDKGVRSDSIPNDLMTKDSIYRNSAKKEQEVRFIIEG